MFLGPDSIGFVWGGVGRAPVQFLQGLLVFVGLFGNLGDPMVLTLRGASGDVVIVYAYYVPLATTCSICHIRL